MGLKDFFSRKKEEPKKDEVVQEEVKHEELKKEETEVMKKNFYKVILKKKIKRSW